jgi:hypothetical protein
VTRGTPKARSPRPPTQSRETTKKKPSSQASRPPCPNPKPKRIQTPNPSRPKARTLNNKRPNSTLYPFHCVTSSALLSLTTGAIARSPPGPSGTFSSSGGGVAGALFPLPELELPGARSRALSTRSWWPAMPCCGITTMPSSLGSFSAGVQAR